MSPTPRIRDLSPVAGLARRRLSFAQVLGQSIAAVAPSAVMVTLPALVLPHAGRATIAVFVVAAIIMTLVGYCAGQFATRMVAVSGLYSYTVKGLGPTAGLAAGWSLIIGYAAAAMASVLGAASYLATLAGRVGLPDGTLCMAVCAVVVGLVALALMVRGVQLSARITLIFETFAVVAAFAVLVVAYVRSRGSPMTTPNVTALSTDPSVGFALLLAVTSFVGFESAGTVASEARNPLVSVSRAIRWTPLALGALYVAAAWLQLAEPVGNANGSVVLVLSGSGTGSTVLSVAMELGITASWFACVMGSTTALSRTVFALGREGVLPAVFGRTLRRYQSPWVALSVAVPIIVAVPVVALLSSGSARDTLVGLLAVSAHGYLVGYILLCLATPVFLRRIGELTLLPLIIGAATAAAMIALIGWAALSGAYAAGAATAVYLALLVLGGLVFAVRIARSPIRREQVGVYDEPTAGDVLIDYRPWDVRE